MSSKIHALLWSCLLAAVVSHGQTPAIIPAPVQWTASSGTFQLMPATPIYTDGSHPETHRIAQYLIDKIAPATGFQWKISAGKPKGGIFLQILPMENTELGEEGYRMDISPRQVHILANTPAGLFYGVQSFLQLLPPAIKSPQIVPNMAWSVPAGSLLDYPRFGYRGLMLDVSRHFFPKAYILEFIDHMAQYKFNRFHWHLTDDQGWRIEIKSLPKLTEVGAWRVPRVGRWNSFDPPGSNEPATDGGFYTQEDIREIVAYARERFIEILPEIDVPGHSMAALAAYPELSCTQDTSIRVNPGSSFATWHANGTFTMHIDNTLNPVNEQVYTFLDKVFTEVAGLFPYEYIHMGGDEAYKGYWEKDPGIRQFMATKGWETMDEVQSYFVGRVNRIIQDKGKKMIGWDEILEGGLAPGAAVMSWRGTKGGIEASHLGAQVVMSPSPMAYLDLYQGDFSIEPPTYGSNRLSATYALEPLVEGMDATRVMGGQGNIWTEHLPAKAPLEYMAWPRGFAVAETYWSPAQAKDWTGFVRRVEQHFLRFDQAQMNYSTALYDPIIQVSRQADGQLVVHLATEVAGITPYYTLDNTLPNPYYQAYTQPIVVPSSVTLFRVANFRGKEQVGKLLSIPISDLEKRLPRK